MSRTLHGILVVGGLGLAVLRLQSAVPARGPIVVAMPGAQAAMMAGQAPERALAPAATAAPVPAAAVEAPASPRAARVPPPTAAPSGAAEAVAALARVSPAAYELAGPPTVAASVMEGILQRYGSPLAGQAQLLIDLGREYGIDSAYCLAFFVHESAAGTRGEAVLTKSMGNIRARAGEPARDGYRLYGSWEESIRDWYRLMRDVYIGRWHLHTVAEIVPVYAPSSDNNDVAAYISDVQTLVSDWRTLSAAGA